MSLRGRGAPLEGLLSRTARESGASDVAARAAGPRRPVSPRPLPACAPRSQSAAGSQAGRARSPRRGRSCGRATPGEAEARLQVTPWPRRAPPAAQTPPRPRGPETARLAPRPLTVVGSPAPRLRDDARAAPPAPATPARSPPAPALTPPRLGPGWAVPPRQGRVQARPARYLSAPGRPRRPPTAPPRPRRAPPSAARGPRDLAQSKHKEKPSLRAVSLSCHPSRNSLLLDLHTWRSGTHWEF